MTDQIREQVSALLDGELPGDEIGLLVRRMERNPELRGTFGRYALIGETLRAPGTRLASAAFAARVSASIDVPQVAAAAQPREAATGHARWARPMSAAAIAASLALVAVIVLQPARQAALVAVESAAGLAGSRPVAQSSPTPAQSQRLAGYLMAHSQFSSPIVRQNVWSGLLAADPGLTRVAYETAEAP